MVRLVHTFKFKPENGKRLSKVDIRLGRLRFSHIRYFKLPEHLGINTIWGGKRGV